MISKLVLAGSLLSAAAVDAAFTPHRKQYSNYAGGASYDTDIVEVSVDIVVPECSPGLPKYDYVPYTSDGWVGMSAFTDEKHALLQTGITCQVSEIEGNVTLRYSAFSEWAPSPPTYYKDHDFKAGDKVTARVVAHSATAGTSYITNHRTGKKHSTKYTKQKVPLSFTNAEWVVESQYDFSEVGPIGERNSAFTPWKFTQAAYRKKDGSTHLLGNEDIYNCVLNGTQIFTAIWEGPGCLQVNDTTPSNYTGEPQPPQ